MFKELNTAGIFFRQPEREFGVREAARLLKVSPATASKRLKQLAKANILKHRHERSLDLYKADVESSAYRDLKVYSNIQSIRKSGLLEALDEFYIKPTIILFGSCAHGYDTGNSDMDFAIISENTKDFRDSGRFGGNLSRKLQIFVVTHLKDLRNEHLVSNVLNGIVLQGEISWNSVSAGKGGLSEAQM